MKRREVLGAVTMASIGLAGCTDTGETADISGQTPDSTDQESTPTPRDPQSTDSPTPSPQETQTPSPDDSTQQTPTEQTPTQQIPCDGPEHSYLTAPRGFHVSTYADSEALGGGPFNPGPQPGPRMLATYQDTLFATIPSQGRVVAFPEDGEQASPSEVVTVVEDLTKPHGIEFHENTLYLALAGSLVRYEMDGPTGVGQQEELVDDIPRGVYHWTRSIAIHDSRLYLSAGVCTSGDCTAGNEDYLSAITAFDLDGSNQSTYATGLRNAVGIEWHDDTLFATDNGIDDLGPDLPPDEINIIEEGNDYGFPNCYGQNTPVEDANEGDCEGKTPPVVEMQAHVAPLGFGFATTPAFPAEYRGDMYVAQHGSWTRDDPVGYKILRVPYDDGELGTAEDFITGWMPEGGTNDDARGRPVDVQVTDDGMYVSDDMSGTIYRICHRGE